VSNNFSRVLIGRGQPGKSPLAAAVELLGDAEVRVQKLAESALSRLYAWSDRRPWRLGYTQYKLQYLGQVLRKASMLELFEGSKHLPAGYGVRLDARVVEIPWALSRLRQTATRVLDAGSSLNYLEVLTSPYLAQKEITILTMAPERRCYWKSGVSYVFGDLRNLLFKEESFDGIACISTVEHVGMDNSLYAGPSAIAARGHGDEFLRAVKEMKRVLRTGKQLYITFPFGQHEDHGWFQQFDSDMTDKLISEFEPMALRETVYRYEADGWNLSDRQKCADCHFFDVRKSRYFDPDSTMDFPPHFPAGEGAVMCLELTK
jgi:SAM-dependent methyltransferase